LPIIGTPEISRISLLDFQKSSIAIISLSRPINSILSGAGYFPLPFQVP